MDILGISAFYHDSAACLLRDGEILAAVAEERFSRCKNDPSFPTQAIQYCLQTAGKIPDYIVFYDKPWLKFERLLESHISVAPNGFNSFAKSLPVWLREKLFLKHLIAQQILVIIESLALEPNTSKKNTSLNIRFSEHHQSHAAAAFYPSPFPEAAILTIDGVGEWTTTSIAQGQNNQIKILQEIHFPHSLGLLYSAFTSYIGFKVNEGEYKLMGLAPYGQPAYSSLIKEKLIHINDDGSFQLDLNYFGFLDSDYMTNQKFHTLFAAEPRQPHEAMTQKHMDIAASIQYVTEEIILKLAEQTARRTGSQRLCLAGGVALNCVANGLLRRRGSFSEIWIQPAAGDSGAAIGAAAAFYYQELNKPRQPTNNTMKNAFLGPVYSNTEIKSTLEQLGAKYQQYHDTNKLLTVTAQALATGKIGGWHQGRLEFGPRALGNRSILAHPAIDNMQSVLNQKIKFRESFRPFAPAVIEEKADEWFIEYQKDPYMLFTAQLHPSKQIVLAIADKLKFGLEKLQVKRSVVPAVTHIDCSARLQTVSAVDNPLFYQLLQEFAQLSGYPLLVNTSFNVKDEPIVCSPADSYQCFMHTDIDLLVIGNFLLWKNEQHHQSHSQPNRLTANPITVQETKSTMSSRQLRVFGLSQTVVLAIVSLICYKNKYFTLLPILITIGIIVLLFSLFKPDSLRKSQIISQHIGQKAGSILANVVLFLLFWLVFTPLAIIFRLTGQNPLSLKVNRKIKSYWIERTRQPESMRLQF